MSQENLDRAREGYRAFVSGNMDAALEFMDTEIECHDFADLPDTAVYHGPEGFLALSANVLETFDEFTIEVKELVDLDDWILAVVHTVGKGKASGAEVEADLIHLWRIRDGKAVELWLFGDRDQALAQARERRTA